MSLTLLDYVDPSRRYTCGQCNNARESFRARDNVPVRAHLCRECARLCEPAFVDAHYVDLDECWACAVERKQRAARGDAPSLAIDVCPVHGRRS